MKIDVVRAGRPGLNDEKNKRKKNLEVIAKQFTRKGVRDIFIGGGAVVMSNQIYNFVDSMVESHDINYAGLAILPLVGFGIGMIAKGTYNIYQARKANIERAKIW